MNILHARRISTLLVLINLIPSVAFAQYGGTMSTSLDGSGTAVDPYRISTAADLYYFADRVNNDYNHYFESHAVLTDDIVINSGTFSADGSYSGGTPYQWTPIGTNTNSHHYKGTFDGGNHTISGLYINSSADYQGLFGSTSNATISNVTIVNSYIKSTSSNVGAIAGQATGGTITNCHNTSGVVGSSIVGGIVGLTSATIVDCDNTGSVEATTTSTSDEGKLGVGGIVGKTSGRAVVTDCHNNGTIKGSRIVAGIVGNAYYGVEISHCYNAGAVTATKGWQSAGILARGQIGGTDKISYCWNSGAITNLANGEMGGIVGCAMPGIVVDSCRNVGVITAKSSHIGGIVGNCSQAKTYTITNCVNEGSIIVTSPSSDAYAGGIMGNNTGTVTIENCHNKADINVAGAKVGGILGSGVTINTISKSHNEGNIQGTNQVGGILGNGVADLSECYNVGNIQGTHQVGGILGSGSKTITECYNTGNVTATSTGTSPTNNGVGGILGYASAAITITDSHNSGAISGHIRAGGIVGNAYSSPVTITKCYNNGNVTATGYYAGGIVAQAKYGNDAGGISYTYNTGTITAPSNLGGIVGYGGYDMKIDSCRNVGAISGSTSTIGGIIGTTYLGRETILHCVNEGTITLTSPAEASYVGGLVGFSGSDCVIRGSQNKTDINIAGRQIGGLIGHAESNSTVDSCANYGNITSAVAVTGSSATGASGNAFIGGIAGYFYGGTISRTQNYAEVVSTHNGSSATARGVGGFVGFLNNTVTISNCLNMGNVAAAYSRIGGIVGNSNQSSTINIDHTYNKGTVTSYRDGWIGGLVGYTGWLKASYCSNQADVNAVTWGVGGIIGYSNYYVIIDSCSNHNAISGKYNIGGLVGCSNNYNGTVTNSVNKGNIIATSGDYAGGLLGYADKTSISHSYNEGSVSAAGVNYVGGLAGSSASVSYSYNHSAVSGNKYVAGITGKKITVNQDCAMAKPTLITNCYNVGAVSGSTSVFAINEAKSEHSYYLTGTATDNYATEATADDFSSGRVCVGLNISQADGQTDFYQTLGTDDYPVLDDAHSVVYCTGQVMCTGAVTGTCTNTYGSTVSSITHSWLSNGLCTVTGEAHYDMEISKIGDVYQIADAGDLYLFAKKVNEGEYDAKAILTADIVVNLGTLSSDGTYTQSAEGETLVEWIPIGDYASCDMKIFKGSIDGAGFSISGLYIKQTSKNYQGFIGNANGATVKNLTIKNSYIQGAYYTAGVCSWSSGRMTIDKCYLDDDVYINGSYYVAGILAYNNYAGTEAAPQEITNCGNSATITATNSHVGGILANSPSDKNYVYITNCYNKGAITGKGENIGGVAGYTYRYNRFTNCYNRGTVTNTSTSTYTGGVVATTGIGSTLTNCRNGQLATINSKGAQVGGIAGYVGGNSTVTNCVDSAAVIGANQTGGIVGHADNYNSNGVSFADCKNYGAITGKDYTGGIVGYGLNYDATTTINCTITHAFNYGTISGSNYVGGIGGTLVGTTTYCENAAEITGTGNYVGGIAGVLCYQRFITASANLGNVSGNNYIGGIAGYQTSASNSDNASSANDGCSSTGNTTFYITSCYNIGTVTGNTARAIALCGSGKGQYYCYYLKGTGEDAYAMEADVEQFNNGCVAQGMNASTQYWRQNLAGSNIDDYPTFDTTHDAVSVTGCAPYKASANYPSANIPSGDGSEANPYLIYTAAQLYRFAEIVNAGQYNACGKLMADIKVNDATFCTDGSWTSATQTTLYAWTPIGDYYTCKNWIYTGTFDGNNHTINGLYIYSSSRSYQGFIGYAKNATVKNLTIENSYFNVGAYSGGIIGYMDMAKNTTLNFNDLHNKIIVIGTNNFVGGVVGRVNNNYDGVAVNFTNCSNESDSVSGLAYTGGLVGYMPQGATFNKCYNTGSVVSTRVGNTSNPWTEVCVGGLCGKINNDKATIGTFVECRNTGRIVLSGTNAFYAGGLVGRSCNGASFDRCYNTGAVEGSQNCAAGLIGSINVANKTLTITNSYNTGRISNRQGYYVGGLYGGDKNNGSGAITIIIRNSYNTGDIVSECNAVQFVGGLFGANGAKSVTIENCYNTGNITTINGQYVGGLYGYTGNPATINDSYNTGSILAANYTGGLVGLLESTLSIRNVANRDGNIKAGAHVGGLFGRVTGAITPTGNIYCEADTVLGTSEYVGGLFGSLGAAVTLTGAYNTAYLQGTGARVGGLIGSADNSATLTNCFNVGDVKSAGERVGGLIGHVTEAATIRNCYNEADVSTTRTSNNSNVAGLVGYTYKGISIYDSYNRGAISGKSNVVAGLVGYTNDNTGTLVVENSYNKGILTGTGYIGGVVGYAERA
ncbi:MAG: hypothetical protein IKR17_02115, partial [Bacteroidales bacterium]|nr:hypothetical protein [Bacteroidales bacterium]